MTFRAYMLAVHEGEYTPIGDLADDIKRDSRFPNVRGDSYQAYNKIRFHIECLAGCCEAIEAFEEAWAEWRTVNGHGPMLVPKTECPFCACDELEIGVSGFGKGKKAAYVMCQGCLAKGPEYIFAVSEEKEDPEIVISKINGAVSDWEDREE